MLKDIPAACTTYTFPSLCNPSAYAKVPTDARMLDCGHSFCQECIFEALRRKPECPNCRAIQRQGDELENLAKPNFMVREAISELEVHDLQQRTVFL